MLINQYLIIFIFFSSLFSEELPSSQQIKHQAIQISKEENSLSILSWNIKMFPYPLGWFYNSVERTENIIKALKNSTMYDIILFQEAFSGSMRNKIFSALKYKYPNQVLVGDKTEFYKINSGLWGISSIPIYLIDFINFTELHNTDRFSSKGAHLYSITKNQQEFFIINTHMQSDYKTQYSNIRINQYTEIQEKLILPHENPEIPLILCGDLNISKPSKLIQMLKDLNFVNGPLIGKIQYSSVGDNHELYDYILIKAKKFKFQSIERRIQNLSNNLTIEPIQLSDHYPIEGILIW